MSRLVAIFFFSCAAVLNQQVPGASFILLYTAAAHESVLMHWLQQSAWLPALRLWPTEPSS